MAPPPRPRTEEPGTGVLHVAMAYAFGLWPLTAVMLLAAGLLVVTARLGAP